MKTLEVKPMNHDSEKLIEALGVTKERAEELMPEVHKYVKEESISKSYDGLLSVSETVNEFAFMVHALKITQDLLKQNPLSMLARILGGRV